MHYPEKKGYSARNLAYMCQFARTFSVEVLQKMLSRDVKLKKPTIDNVQSATRILNNLQFVQEVPAQIKEIGRTISYVTNVHWRNRAPRFTLLGCKAGRKSHKLLKISIYCGPGGCLSNLFIKFHRISNIM